MRIDNDISEILLDEYKNFKENIFEMFVEFGDNLHAMRATEMGLKVKYRDWSGHCNLFIGSSAQLGRLLLSQRDKIIELS